MRNENHPLNLGIPKYGDITARWAGETQLDLFLTATTGASGGFPFVMRVRIDLQGGSVTPQVIVTSQGTTAGAVNLPPGITVNAAGLVLTTLPFPIPVDGGGFADSLVTFGADFPENANGTPQFILRDPNTQTGIIDLASSGMTVDESGNFYIATGVVGSSICGPNGSGALVFINRELSELDCVPVGGLIRSADVAVSPIDNVIYMTIADANGSVLRFDAVVAPGQ